MPKLETLKLHAYSSDIIPLFMTPTHPPIRNPPSDTTHKQVAGFAPMIKILSICGPFAVIIGALSSLSASFPDILVHRLKHLTFSLQPPYSKDGATRQVEQLRSGAIEAALMNFITKRSHDDMSLDHLVIFKVSEECEAWLRERVGTVTVNRSDMLAFLL